MRFLIVGPGAMGLLFAARLKKFSHQDVMLLDYKKDRAELLNKNGIKVEGIRGTFHVNIPVRTREEIEVAPDFVMLFVKAYNTKDAAHDIKDIINDDTLVISLQNGLGNIEILESIIKKKVYGGITAEGATLIDVGHVRHAGYGDTIIGPFQDRLLDLRDILDNAGFKTEIRDDIDGVIWGKLLINIAINPLTAIIRVRNGMLPKVEGARKIMEDCLREAMQIVEKKGIKLPYKDPVEKSYEVCQKTEGNISSMLQDVIAQRPTEIEFLNGAIVREGERLGINTPTNNILLHLIHSIEKTYKDKVV